MGGGERGWQLPGLEHLWDPEGQLVSFVVHYHGDLYILSLFPLPFYVHCCPHALFLYLSPLSSPIRNTDYLFFFFCFVSVAVK